MNHLHAVWCFIVLAFACAVSSQDLGFSVITGLSLLFWSALVYYGHGRRVRDNLETENDQKFARMQEPGAKEAMQRAFDTAPGASNS